MFDYITGILKKSSENKAVIDVGGVGYIFNITLTTYRSLPALNNELTLKTHVIHREDTFELTGFYTENERLVFRKLISLSGIGPKQAIKILSGLDIHQLVGAIAQEDILLLQKIPGLGKKTAEKLVFELRGRLDDIEIQNIQPGTGRLPVDAIAAMEALGFSEIKSRAAVFEALKEDGSSETEDIVKRALKHI